MRALLHILFVFLIGLSCHAEVVNMFAGRELGGFGDVASNLIMAQKLVELRPNLRIQFWVGKKEERLLRVLLPALNLNNGYQFLEGIHFYSHRHQQLPKGDVFLAFSVKTEITSPYAKDFHLPQELLDTTANEIINKIANAPVVVKFKEYDGSTQQVADVFALSGQITEIEVETGALAAGLYVNPTNAAPATSFVSVSGTDRGFAYSAYPYATITYLNAINVLAKRNPNKNYEVTLKKVIEISLPQLEPNLKIIELEKIDFHESNELIREATLPVLVTGDVSMSLAIQNGKPFFYEMNRWKKKSVRALKERLGRGMTPRQQTLLEKMLSLPAYETPPDTLGNDNLIEVLESPELLLQISRGLSDIVADASLPLFTLRLIDSIRSADTRASKSIRSAIQTSEIRVRPTLSERVQMLFNCKGLLTKPIF